MANTQALKRIIQAACLALVLAYLFAGQAMASEPPKRIEVVNGKSIILDSENALTRVSLASPNFAELVLISPHQLYVTGKKPGATTLTLWGKNGKIEAVYDVEVVPDITHLKTMLHNILPQETGIQVVTAGDSITLSGTVSSTTNLSTAVSLAKAYAPDKVVNLMNVGGVHQVMLEVKVAEMNREHGKKIGFNFNYRMGNNFFYTFLDSLSMLDDKGNLLIGPEANGAFSVTDGQDLWTFIFKALKSQGVIKILAEPNLICLSGQSASFLAGGEIPIPVPQGWGTVAIEYKPFGVGLTFTPTVLSGNRISLQVKPEVSELDYTKGVEISGWTVPGISSRRASTTVELGDGQSFAIAGLLKNYTKETIEKMPLVGDVPVLGNLFRSSNFQKEETELVIIVTPRLVKPTNMAGKKLPTDDYVEPDDVDFYLMGFLEGREKMAYPGKVALRNNGQEKQSGFDGDMGMTPVR